MSEHLQLPPFIEYDKAPVLDDEAHIIYEKLTEIVDDLGPYDDTRRDGLVYSFLKSRDGQTSVLEYTGTAVMMLKHEFVDESQLEKFFSQSSVFALKKGLLLLEGVAKLDELDEANLIPVRTTTTIIARELASRDYEKSHESSRFVEKHYTGDDWD